MYVVGFSQANPTPETSSRENIDYNFEISLFIVWWRLPDEDIILSVFPDAGEKGTPRGWMTISIERVRVPGRVFVVPTRTERGTSEVKILAGLLSI